MQGLRRFAAHILRLWEDGMDTQRLLLQQVNLTAEVHTSCIMCAAVGREHLQAPTFTIPHPAPMGKRLDTSRLLLQQVKHSACTGVCILCYSKSRQASRRPCQALVM